MLLQQHHIDDFVNNGASVVDGLLDKDIILAAEKEMDEQYAADVENPTGIRQYILGPGYEQLIQDPVLEQVVQEALGCEAVHLLATATLHTAPVADYTGKVHVDIQYNSHDWLETPRSVMLTMMIFLDDVPENRAPTLVSTGSHLLLARYNDSHGEFSPDPVLIENLPDLKYNALTPLTGKKGQLALSTTAVLHVGSPNTSDRPRKVMFISFTSTHICPMFNSAWLEKRIEYLQELESRFAPDRKHLVRSSIEMMKQSL